MNHGVYLNKADAVLYKLRDKLSEMTSEFFPASLRYSLFHLDNLSGIFTILLYGRYKIKDN